MHGPSLVVDPRALSLAQRGLARAAVARDGALRAACRPVRRLCRRAARACSGSPISASPRVELMPVNDFPGQRNWGYDGVLPFAPDRAYGSPDDLKALVDAAHDHGLMIFLDVVYNHFGPDGNYLASYAPQFFRDDVATPWGAGDRLPPPRSAALLHRERALLADGVSLRRAALRRRARHHRSRLARRDGGASPRHGRARTATSISCSSTTAMSPSTCARDFDAQWNDDGHHVLHVMLTGESEGYYGDYADRAGRAARALPRARASSIRASRRAHRNGEPRGTPSADLPPTAFVLFLQNHDQIGNRAFGDRLTASVAAASARSRDRAAAALPADSAASSWARRTPARRRSSSSPTIMASSPTRCAKGAGASSRALRPSPIRRAARSIPDPNAAETFERSRPQRDAERGDARAALLSPAARRCGASIIVPHLEGAKALGARSDRAVGGAGALAAGRWRGAGRSPATSAPSPARSRARPAT